jgi:leucyl-tRNA synthetase
VVGTSRRGAIPPGDALAGVRSALAESPRITLVVQVNGRVRGRIELERGAAESEAVERARSDDRIRPWLEGKAIRRAVYVADRLLNLVL